MRGAQPSAVFQQLGLVLGRDPDVDLDETSFLVAPTLALSVVLFLRGLVGHYAAPKAEKIICNFEAAFGGFEDFEWQYQLPHAFGFQRGLELLVRIHEVSFEPRLE